MEWIITANKKQFDVKKAFSDREYIDWQRKKPQKNISENDIVYIYVGRPDSKIMIKTKCVWSNVPRDLLIDDRIYWNNPDLHDNNIGFFRLKRLAIIDNEKCSLQSLQKKGLIKKDTTIEGSYKSQNHPELFEYIDELFEESTRGYYTNSSVNEIEQTIEDYIHNVVSGTGGQRKAVSNVYVRSAEVIRETKKRANGICQLCSKPAPFIDKNGEPYLEVHHVIWLSRGGEDSTENTVALCPNCHSRMHVIDSSDEIEQLRKTINSIMIGGQQLVREE